MSQKPVDPPTRTWRSLVVVLLFAASTVGLFEAAIHRLAPMPRRDLEVDDGVAQVKSGNPRFLVLGSSHAGSYLPLLKRLGPENVAVITEEGGSFSAFEWVYRERLAGFLNDKRPDGGWQRDHLREVMLVTTYWDACPAGQTGFAGNLPARAWLLQHYLADVWEHGFTSQNRNFPFTEFKRLFSASMLAQDRGLWGVRDSLKGVESPDSIEGRKRAWVERRRPEMEQEGLHCQTPDELAALDRLIDAFQTRGAHVTLVAFPLMPELLTDVTRQNTLGPFSTYLASLAERRHVRVIDHTTRSPMVYGDFELDCDHLTIAAREKYIDWALAGDLGFLRAESP